MSMSDMNFCDSFWILTTGLNRRTCIINLSAFYLSCFLPGCLVVWTRRNPLAYLEWRLGGSTQLHLRNFLNCVFAQKFCPSSAPEFMKSKKIVQENVKNCTLISHFASASGRRPPDTLLVIFLRPYWGRKSPDFLPPPLLHNSWSTPVNSLHCEIFGMPMVKAIPITIPPGSWLWLLQTHWGNVRLPHIGYYSSCYLYKMLS